MNRFVADSGKFFSTLIIYLVFFVCFFHDFILYISVGPNNPIDLNSGWKRKLQLFLSFL